MTGNIIDICGSSAAGKTQLCTTIAINLAQHCDIEIFFVDTKGDFSGKRVHKILAKRVCTESDMEKIMKRLRVERINDPYQLVAVLNALIANRSNFRDLKVLVIDSLPALWFLFHGDKKSKGLCICIRFTLNSIGNFCRLFRAQFIGNGSKSHAKVSSRISNHHINGKFSDKLDANSSR